MKFLALMFALVLMAASIPASSANDDAEAGAGAPADGAALIALIESSIAGHLEQDAFSLDDGDEWIIELDGARVDPDTVRALDTSGLAGLEITSHDDGRPGGVIQLISKQP